MTYLNLSDSRKRNPIAFAKRCLQHTCEALVDVFCDALAVEIASLLHNFVKLSLAVLNTISWFQSFATLCRRFSFCSHVKIPPNLNYPESSYYSLFTAKQLIMSISYRPKRHRPLRLHNSRSFTLGRWDIEPVSRHQPKKIFRFPEPAIRIHFRAVVRDYPCHLLWGDASPQYAFFCKKWAYFANFDARSPGKNRKKCL